MPTDTATRTVTIGTPVDQVLGTIRAVETQPEWIKEILEVEEAGGACVICGYKRCVHALEFHHRDPSQKSFGLAHRGVTRSIAEVRREAKKCVLLCATCHVEVERGVTRLPEAIDPG